MLLFLIGTPQNKHAPLLVTEFDEYYQHEIKHRPRHKIFQKSIELETLRKLFRQKYTTLYIQSNITERIITQKMFESYLKDFDDFEIICRNLFRQWKDTYHRRAMKKQQDLEPIYKATLNMRKLEENLRKELICRGSKIMFLEDIWIRRIQYQNFHFLVADLKWRNVFDWIHRDEKTQLLENSRKSIDERSAKNFRMRDQDNPWAVKSFYEQNYEKLDQKLLFPSKNADDFRNAITLLKIRSFIALIDLHFKMWILSNMEREYHDFIKWSKNHVEKQQKNFKIRYSKKYFMEDRVTNLKELAYDLIETDLAKSISWPLMRNVIPMCDLMYEHFIPASIRSQLSIYFSIINKFQMISELVTTTLTSIDSVPKSILIKTENDIRKKRKFIMCQSERALATENQTKCLLDGLIRNMQPPYRKIKRIGKLPRSTLPKREPKPPKPQSPLSMRVKLFYEAFTDMTVTDVSLDKEENIEILNSLQSNCIPFYYDHFLKLHNYIPIYDFKTDIECRDGAEEKKFKYLDLMAEVEDAMKNWERYKKIEEEHFIRKGWYLYVDKDGD